MMRRLRSIFLVAVTLISLAGCAVGQTAKPTNLSLPGVTSTESTRAKITNADAQKRIAAVERNKTIPEAAKPGIIAGIKHDAGLQ